MLGDYRGQLFADAGLLTGKMTRERAHSLQENDWRSRDADFKEPKLSRNLELVEVLRAIWAAHGKVGGPRAGCAT